MVRILIREGQSANEQSQKFKNTPLHIAAKHGHTLIVKFLLSQGALTNIANLWGRTPIDMAQESCDVLNT